MSNHTQPTTKEILGPDYIPIIAFNQSKRYGMGLVLLEYWLIIIVVILTNKWYFDFAIGGLWPLWLILPLSIFGIIYYLGFLSMVFSWILLKILRKIEPPKEGEFEVGGREFRYYCRRFWIVYYCQYILRSMPLPWVDMYGFRLLGVKVGKNDVLYDAYVDIEFVEIGDFVMLSLNSSLLSHCVYNNKFVVKKVIVKRTAIVGAHSVAAPGTVFEEGAILAADASAKLYQHLEAYSTHIGNPAWRSIPIRIADKSKLSPPNVDVEKPKKDQ